MTFHGDIYAHRRVWRVEPGDELVLPLRKNSWESTGINAILYLGEIPEEDIEVMIRAEGLPPMHTARTADNLTIPQRKFVLDPEAPAESSERALLDNGEEAVFSRRLFFPVHDDVEPGKYELVISTEMTAPVYFRFFQLERINGTAL